MVHVIGEQSSSIALARMPPERVRFGWGGYQACRFGAREGAATSVAYTMPRAAHARRSVLVPSTARPPLAFVFMPAPSAFAPLLPVHASRARASHRRSHRRLPEQAHGRLAAVPHRLAAPERPPVPECQC